MGARQGLVLDVPVKPVPASRPNVTRWRTYYGKQYTAFRDEAKKFLAELRHSPVAVYDGPLAVLTEIICPRPKSTKKYWPRGDIDNYEKAIWDSITNSKRWWADDDQIVFNASHKRWAGKHEQPGIQLTIYPLEYPE